MATDSYQEPPGGRPVRPFFLLTFNVPSLLTAEVVVARLTPLKHVPPVRRWYPVPILHYLRDHKLFCDGGTAGLATDLKLVSRLDRGFRAARTAAATPCRPRETCLPAVLRARVVPAAPGARRGR